VERKIESPNRELGSEYTGETGAMRRLGRAVSLRQLPNAAYDRARKAYGHKGPYLPMIYQACREDEFSYEYRHGVTSFGAFTYCLAAVLRRYGHQGEGISFEQLLRRVGKDLKELGYDQKPCLVGPRARRSREIPWRGSGSKRRRRQGK